MMKNRRAGNEQRAEKLNRYLAEMVLKSPSTNSHAKSSASRAAPPPGRKGKGKVKVKEESVEPDLGFSERERTEPPIPIPASKDADVGANKKAIAMSLVDFGFVLGLVFGGCCRFVYPNRAFGFMID
jgi:hypothetical protein